MTAVNQDIRHLPGQPEGKWQGHPIFPGFPIQHTGKNCRDLRLTDAVITEGQAVGQFSSGRNRRQGFLFQNRCAIRHEDQGFHQKIRLLPVADIQNQGHILVLHWNGALTGQSGNLQLSTFFHPDGGGDRHIPVGLGDAQIVIRMIGR